MFCSRVLDIYLKWKINAYGRYAIFDHRFIEIRKRLEEKRKKYYSSISTFRCTSLSCRDLYLIHVSFRSWLYLFCTRCHGRDDTPSWEPPGWRRACPQPFCPTYRKFARVLCLFLLGLLLWGVVYSVIGNDAAPGGQLFGLAALCIAAHFGGWLISLTTLPALIGMLITGLILQNVGWVKIEGQYTVVVSNLRWVCYREVSKVYPRCEVLAEYLVISGWNERSFRTVSKNR